MARFTLPRDLYHGKGALEELKNLKGKKAFIVIGGGSMKRFGFLDKVEGYLREAGMEIEVFEGVEPDPSVETVMSGAEAMRKFEPDWIVAMGGGSPIDAAKAMWIFYEYPDFTFEKAVIPFGLPELRQKAKFVAIPSTSGTATEVTAFSVITDYKARIKYPLADFNITPDIAIVDPELAQTMPKELVAHTGMDALTHAIEGYFSTTATPFTDSHALYSAKLIADNLPIVVKEGSNVEARGNMLMASAMAITAFGFGNNGVPVHNMAHVFGAKFRIPHGLANAVLLPNVMAALPALYLPKIKQFAEALGIETSSSEPQECLTKVIEFIRDLREKIGLSDTFAEFNLDSNILDYIVEEVQSDSASGKFLIPADIILKVTEEVAGFIQVK